MKTISRTGAKYFYYRTLLSGDRYIFYILLWKKLWRTKLRYSKKG